MRKSAFERIACRNPIPSGVGQSKLYDNAISGDSCTASSSGGRISSFQGGALQKIYVAAPEVVTVLGSGDSFWSALCRGESGLKKACDAFPQWFCNDARYVGAMPLSDGTSRLDQVIGLLLERINPRLFAEVQLIYAATSLGDLLGPHAGRPHELIRERLSTQPDRFSIVSSACSSGSDALSLGYLALKSNAADSALIIAADSLCPAKLAHHIALGTQSPTRARPFDQNRDGTSFGEGGASLLLATEQGLARLGYEPKAELKGVGFSCDGYDITVPDPTGQWAADAIRSAMPELKESLYVNAHGTGTQLNDHAEAKALRAVLDVSRCKISSTKGAIGHCLGATGLIEAIVAVQALATGKIPCTAGLAQIDPLLELPVLSEGPALEERVNQALSVTFGFGGVNSAIFFERV